MAKYKIGDKLLGRASGNYATIKSIINHVEVCNGERVVSSLMSIYTVRLSSGVEFSCGEGDFEKTFEVISLKENLTDSADSTPSAPPKRRMRLKK